MSGCDQFDKAQSHLHLKEVPIEAKKHSIIPAMMDAAKWTPPGSPPTAKHQPTNFEPAGDQSDGQAAHMQDAHLAKDLDVLQKYRRLVDYLSAAQLYLQDNVLLTRELQIADIKERLLGHWGKLLAYP
jgi:hypothetical protein